jgi:REP element-mobilizing transposase RayT
MTSRALFWDVENKNTMAVNYWKSLQEGCFYHVYNRSIGNEKLFITLDNYRFFLAKWKLYLPYLDVFAYCLMPNHFHFIVRVRELDEALKLHAKEQCTSKSRQFLQEEITYATYLEDQFKRLFSSYALALNKQQKRHGSLFQKSFKRVLIQEEKKLLYLLAYVHHNPIHHNLTTTYGDWLFSSWHAFVNTQASSIIQRQEVLKWFDDDPALAFTQFHEFHTLFRIDKRMDDDVFDG